MILVLASTLLGCRTPDPDPPRPPDEAVLTADTGAIPSAETGPTSDTAARCPVPVATLDYVGSSTLAVLDVQLAREAPVAAWCRPDVLPDDVLFAESTLPSTAHELRLRGLAGGLDSTCTVVALCDDGPSEPVSVPAPFRAITQGMGPLTLTDGPVDPQGQVLLSAVSPTGFGITELVAYGPAGRPRWWHRLPPGVLMFVEARYHPDDDLIVWGGGMTPGGRPQQVDPWDGPVWTFWSPEAGAVFHHDGKQLDDGRVLTLELWQHAAEGPLAVPYEGYRVRGVDPATQTFFLDVSSETPLAGGWLDNPDGDADPWHANWVDLVRGPSSEGPADPELMLSLCYDWSVLSVEPTTGEPRWLLRRGEGWTVRDADGTVLDEEALPRCTHGLEVDGDRVLLYDNGQTTDTSSAEEWSLDPATRTATKLWEWTEPGWQEDFLGDVDWLGADRVVITQARLAGIPEVLEVDRSTDEVVRRWDFAGNGRVYRAELLPTCTLLPQLTAACPATAARYAEVQSLLQ